MLKIFLLICLYFFIVNGVFSSAVTNCISTKKVNIQYKNFYHDFVYQKDWNKDILVGIAKGEICTSYVLGGSPDDIVLDQVIPVYFPKNSTPKLYQFVYTGQDYTDHATMKIGSGFFWGIGASSISGGHALIPWFRSGIVTDSRWQDSSAYLQSTQEPFKSAPMLQMYYYLGQPLLVARSSTGLVTDVFFQSRPSITNPMERAKKYLGKKWYNP